jgi:hypothetical protein
MNTAPITSRDEFLQVLATTTSDIDAFAAREPAYPPWGSLQKQLHAMADWLAAGGPTAEEQARISIGLIAARELETAAIPGIDELINRIYRLQYAWNRWPLAGA